MNDNETVADIVAEMRESCQRVGCHFNEAVEKWAARIEAALKREGSASRVIHAACVKRVCEDLMINEQFCGRIPTFAITCRRFDGSIPLTGIYRMELDYDCGMPPFDMNAVRWLMNSIDHLLSFVANESPFVPILNDEEAKS